jgi:hypothetical protein
MVRLILRELQSLLLPKWLPFPVACATLTIYDQGRSLSWCWPRECLNTRYQHLHSTKRYSVHLFFTLLLFVNVDHWVVWTDMGIGRNLRFGWTKLTLFLRRRSLGRCPRYYILWFLTLRLLDVSLLAHDVFRAGIWETLVFCASFVQSVSMWHKFKRAAMKI